VTSIADPATAALAPSGRVRLLDRFTSPSGLDLRTFLARNGVPFEWVDIDADPLARFLLSAATAPGGEIEAGLAGVRLPVRLEPGGLQTPLPVDWGMVAPEPPVAGSGWPG